MSCSTNCHHNDKLPSSCETIGHDWLTKQFELMLQFKQPRYESASGRLINDWDCELPNIDTATKQTTTGGDTPLPSNIPLLTRTEVRVSIDGGHSFYYKTL